MSIGSLPALPGRQILLRGQFGVSEEKVAKGGITAQPHGWGHFFVGQALSQQFLRVIQTGLDEPDAGSAAAMLLEMPFELPDGNPDRLRQACRPMPRGPRPRNPFPILNPFQMPGHSSRRFRTVLVLHLSIRASEPESFRLF